MSRKNSHTFTQDPLEVQSHDVYPHLENENTRLLPKEKKTVSIKAAEKKSTPLLKNSPKTSLHSFDNELTPLLQPSMSLPTVVGYDGLFEDGQRIANTTTRSEIGQHELTRKKRKRRSRFNTLQSVTQKLKPRPILISPFMPIPTQFSVEGPRSVQTKDHYEPISGSFDVKLSHSSDEDESDAESEVSDEEQTDSLIKNFATLTSRQWLTMAMLSLANLCSTIAFSCIAPFYPTEAKLKNLSETQTGVVFGIFELTMFIVSPIFGKYIIAIQARRMFIVGIAVTGITAILFGFLNYLPSGPTFFWLSVVVRIFEALGDAAFVTSSFAIAAKSFPKNIAFVVGVLETFAGLGYTAGPVIGGFFYDLGGFQLPFLALGIVLLLASVLAFLLVENTNDSQSENGNRGMMDILVMPTIWIPIFSVISCAISLSFLDPTLSNHLESFTLTPTEIGLMFLLCGGFYTVMSFVFGAIMDKYHTGDILIFFGSVSTFLSMFFIGPTPLLAEYISKDLWVIGISLAVLGIAASALYIPCFQMCLDEVQKRGFEDNFHTYGCVSGIFQAAFGLGSFIGPTFGSIVVEKLGFAWTTTGIALLHVALSTVIFFNIIRKMLTK